MASRSLRIPFVVLVVGLAARSAQAQHVAITALGDLEGWKTDSGSFVLARNHGDAQPLGRLTLFGTLQVTNRLSARALFEASAATGRKPVHSFQLAEVRYVQSRALILEAGQILMPVGAFAARRFSNVNPLIAGPDLYISQYPLGAQLSGALGPVDYRAAVISEAVTHPQYVVDANFQPQRDTSARGAFGFGISAGPAFHVGMSYTHGPYLGRNADPQMPAGTQRRDFPETIIGVDARWSLSYIELRGEYIFSRYDVPTIGDSVTGEGMYIEAKVTASPRVFAAARFEINDYAFILPVNAFFWVGNRRKLIDGEVGIGYRLGSNTLIKASYRRDSWPDPDPPGGPAFPDGYAVAVQLSHSLSFGF